MNRIEAKFAEARAAGRRLLMPFVCGGSPDAQRWAEVLPALERGGASIVEVGIPFSDPIADGPVIASAMHEALGRGATPMRVLDQVASVRGRVGLGLVAMCSVSIVHRMGGPTGFARAAGQAGFDGMIVPDVPLEESEEIRSAAREAGLTCSLLVSPNTPRERAAAIAQACSGFVYALARSGITGMQSAPPDVGRVVRMLKEVGTAPVACGFGISTAEHVRAVIAGGADAAIVGSAVVRRLSEVAVAGGNVAAAADAMARELLAGL